MSAGGANEPSTNERPIALCGFMGVGKSSIGSRLATALGREFVDSDTLAVERAGDSIAEMFAAGEEERFRALEAGIIAELVHRRPPLVIALGGGALLDVRTRELLLEESVLVHLEQPFSEIASALPSLRRGRPLIAKASEEEVRELYEARRALYALAPVQVQMERRGVAAATEAVLQAIGATISGQ